ncbi:MAG: hypothetical protein P1R74_08095, partial [Sedimenticola sp.]|nr:hypothetical protein [Sedimenticola sp.]
GVETTPENDTQHNADHQQTHYATLSTLIHIATPLSSLLSLPGIITTQGILVIAFDQQIAPPTHSG